jgi:hypothetical protein
MTIARRLLLLAAILPGFCAYLVVSGSRPSQARQEGELARPTSDVADRLREGTVLELSGTFKPLGDRIMFYSSTDNRRFGTLENLNLERITRLVTEGSDAMQWSVTGTVTEFQGANYLLVSRAVVNSKLPRQANASPEMKKI